MKTIAIEGTLRTELGSKTAKQIRREGNVPCVIYGGEENIHFHTPEVSFKELLYTPEAHLVEINLDGKTYRTVIRDVQYHPVSDAIEHVDFFQTSADKAVTIEVPINLVGNSRGVRNGGRLKVNLRKLKVTATEANLPGHIDIDITEVRIGQSVRVSDVNTDGYEISHEPQRTILTVQTSRNAVADEDEDEGAEGEEATAEGGEATEAPAEA